MNRVPAVLPLDGTDQASTEEAKLPRRDWIVLPALGLLVVCLIMVSTELTARSMFAYSDQGLKDCTIFNDPATGPRGIPNCVVWDKGFETQPIQYRLNSSGFRADADFGAKPPGTYRIVMVGSSVAMAYQVENQRSFASLLPRELTAQTGRRVELLNEGFAGGSGINLRLNEALAFRPDLILWILTPWDIGQGFAAYHHPPRANKSVPFVERAWARLKLEFAASSSNILQETFDGTRSAVLLRHFLFKSQERCIKSFLMADDKEAGFLKTEPSTAWRDSLLQFSSAAARNAEQAQAAGVPLVTTLVPARAQAAMISIGEWPDGYDPYRLNDELRSITLSHGGTYIDIFPGFRAVANPERLYFPVDGHLNADGNAMVSQFLASALTSGRVPAIRAAARPPMALAQENIRTGVLNARN